MYENRAQKTIKIIPNLIQNGTQKWEGLGGSGERFASHVGPQGRPEAPSYPKTTLEVPLGSPLWEAILQTFSHFLMFFGACFFEGRFGGLVGSILIGFWDDFRWYFLRLLFEFLLSGEACQMSFRPIIYST